MTPTSGRTQGPHRREPNGRTRRRFLAGVAGVGVAGAATAGCLGGAPVSSEAAGLVPTGAGSLAAGTHAQGSLDRPPRGTWVVGLDGDGGVDWRRRHDSGRWPGDDRLAGVCPLEDGALLVGSVTREAVLVDDALVHAVDAAGETRWRRTVDAASGVAEAAEAADGVVVAGPSRSDDGRPALWVAGLDSDGGTRWARTVSGRAVGSLHRPGDGTTVVAGHATDGGADVPWLAVLDAAGGVVAERRYDDDGALSGLSLSFVTGAPGRLRAVATPAASTRAAGGSTVALVLDEDLRVGDRLAVDLTADFIRAEGEGRDDDPVRFVDAVGDGARTIAVLGEGGWSTVATFDAGMTRTAEVLLQAATRGVHRGPDGGLLLGGSQRRRDDSRRAWLARLHVRDVGVLHDWTTTIDAGRDD